MGTLMRLGSLATAPERNENHRLVKVVFSRGDLVDSMLLGVERSLYFPSGKSPVHAEGHSEEIIYFRQGRGKVLLGDDYVQVGPGDAVPIPGGIAHHVVNTGEDILEHVLISAEIAGCPLQKDYRAQPGDCMGEDQMRRLSRLTCRKSVVAQGTRTAEVTRDAHESVYTLSSGFAIAHIKLAGTEFEWQYALDASHCIWIPAGIPHSFRNIGDCPVHLVEFQCRAK